MKLSRTGYGALALATTSAMLLAGCASGGSGDAGSTGGAITVGTTEVVTSLDPAGAYDNGSFGVMTNISTRSF